MGFRLYLGKISKKIYENVQGMTYEEVVKKYIPKNSGFHNFKGLTEVYCLGKNLDTYPEDCKKFFPFDVDDTDFLIVSKDYLKALIEDYRKSVHENYKTLWQTSKNVYDGYEVSKEDLAQLCMELRQKIGEWEGVYVKPYWLEEEHTDGFVVRSWKYEYAIFNLVHILRSFNWERDQLILYGW